MSQADGQLEVLRSALRAEVAARATDTVVDLGRARIVPGRSGPATGAFTVETGERRLGDEPLTPLYLSPAAEGSARFAVIDGIVWEGDRLLVEAELAVDEEAALAGTDHRPLHLFAAARPGLVPRQLLAALTPAREPGLGAALLEAAAWGGTGPGPLPTELGVILGASGPRRRTLVQAVEQLVEADRSVLVLSADPSALDSVVVAADRALGGPPAGTVLRVGLPSTLRVGSDPRLTPGGLAPPELVRRLGEVTGELRDLLARPGRVDGSDEPGAATEGPVAASSDGLEAPELERARHELQVAEAAVAEAVVRAGRASSRHAGARQALRQLEEVRTVHRQVDELVHRVEQATADVAASASGVGRLAADEARQRQLVVAAEVAAARLDRRDRAVADLEEAQVRAAHLPHTRADVAVAERAAVAARAAHAAAERAALRARADRARAARRLGELSRVAPSRPAGASAQPSGPAAGSDHLPARGVGDPERMARLSALREEYRLVRREIAARHTDRTRTARVLATTFDQLVSDPALRERRYDNVLVERAGQVPAAFVLWAAGRARRALTLGVDPGERPPPPALPEGSVASVERRWLSENLLELIGLGDLEAVRRHPSGIVLA